MAASASITGRVPRYTQCLHRERSIASAFITHAGSQGAFSHSAGTAPIITVIIQVTTLKTTCGIMHTANFSHSARTARAQRTVRPPSITGRVPRYTQRLHRERSVASAFVTHAGSQSCELQHRHPLYRCTCCTGIRECNPDVLLISNHLGTSVHHACCF